MSIVERLSATPSGGQVSGSSLPSGWTPSVAYNAQGVPSEITTLGTGVPGDDSWTDDVRALGVTIPDGYVCRLVEVRHDPAAWVRHAQGEDAVTSAVTRRRYVVERATATRSIDELVASVGKPRKKTATPDGEAWAYVHALSDWQIGKVAYGEGTESTIQRILDALDQSVTQIKKTRRTRPIGTIVLALLGDMCEGIASQNGGVLLGADLTITEQLRIVRRLILEHVTALAPLADRLVVPVAPGNHDQPHRLMGMTPRADDSFLVEAACQVADALEFAGGYDHVSVVTPERDDLTVTVDAAGTILGVTHGHQIKRGTVHTWWARQSHARHRVGSATLLLTGHYHHLAAQVDGDRTWIQAPTVDTGSPHYDQSYGGRTITGTLTLMTKDNRWDTLSVI